MNKVLSIIIPSWKDPLLHKTIDSLLENSELGEDLEVIAVLDGYWPETPIKEDKRIKIIHLGQNGGMRNAINMGVALARGEYIMRMDEHQIVGKGYDRILLENIEDNWIVTPRRFFLDPVKWEVMDIPPVDYMKLIIDTKIPKFGGARWTDRDSERKDILIDETMAMQGSCWIMKKSWWEKVIGELQEEGYGPLYQDSVEMVFKTWKAGGKLMVNKNTWHAHKHRSFKRKHNHDSVGSRLGWKYAITLWEDYFYNEIRPQWNK